MDLATALELLKIGTFVLGILAVLGVISIIVGLLKAIRGLFKFGVVLCVGIVILSLVGVLSGKQIVKTLKIDDKIDKVVDKVSDDGLKKKVNNYVQDMINSGTITGEQIDKYIEGISKDPSLSLTLPDGTVVGAYVETPDSEASENGSAGTDASSDSSVQATQNNNTVNNGGNTISKEDKSNNDNKPGAATQEPKHTVNSGYGSTADKVMSAMSASDLATTQSVMSKVDIGHLQNLMDTDMAQAKAYVKSVLTSAEIAAAVNVYGKYAYLLN